MYRHGAWGYIVKESMAVHNECKWMHLREMECPGYICMPLIRMLNRMIASFTLLWNGQLDGAGMARGSG